MRRSNKAELNLRETSGANFSRIVLAAAYAQQGRADDVARVVTTIHRIDPTFDAQEFGTKFLNSADLGLCATDCAKPASGKERPAWRED